jgi:hypothetical protein
MVETSLEAVALCGASLLSGAFAPVYRATIKVRQRIASSEMLLNTELLPHVNCSPPGKGAQGDEEAIEHGDAHGTEVCFGAAL